MFWQIIGTEKRNDADYKNKKPKIIWAFYLSIGYNYFENNALAIIILEN